MCGILCYIWRKRGDQDENEKLADYAKCKCLIQQRGPDSFGEKIQDLQCGWQGFFAASVLWMQGPDPVAQPIVDSHGNVLLWNGDIFSGTMARDKVSDTQILLECLRDSENIPETLRKVRGPYSVIYYQATRGILYFARDPIGRHSLLMKISSESLTLTSSGSCDKAIEVPVLGVFAFDLETSRLGLHPWRTAETRWENALKTLETRLAVELIQFDAPCPRKNGESPIVAPTAEEIFAFESLISDDKISPMEDASRVMKKLSESPEIRERIQRVLKLLKKSLELRVKKKPDYCKNCVRSILAGEKITCDHSKLGILFSGGLDSTILAALADEFIPRDESIDLVNVAFEKIRKIDPKAKKNLKKDSENLAINFDVPDRKTGREALAELRKICPWRTWNFIECNVTQEELQKYRSSRIRDLVYPLTTILDDSLGCALWFASRGSGSLAASGEAYESPARVLLLGMGADELFGGYTRHRTTLRRGGWPALTDELEAELARISERNLGRDDRVVADHGRQSRLPYLDEDFVDYVSSLKPWERCYPTETLPAGLGDKLLLRLVAREIGLHRTANFPKRAFQFGSRIANSKENAKDESKWI